MDNHHIEFMQFMCYLPLNYAGLVHLGTSSPITMKQPCSNAPLPPGMIKVHWMSKLYFNTLLCFTFKISVQLSHFLLVD